MSEASLHLSHGSGECEIDLVRRELRVLGSLVPVGARAFEVIEVLVRSAGELVTKEELMNRIWPGAIVMENTLQVHAVAIRKALGPYRGLLKTESRRGYRLLGEWIARRHDAAAPPVGLQRIRLGREAPGSNLPGIVTRLIGRTAAVRQLLDLISAYRIVTLTGPGGIGKTTLALKVASRILGQFEDGGWFVELASLSGPALVLTTVAQGLRLGLGGADITGESIARAIGEKHLLLVLDNCEHVIDAVADLVEMLVRLCPRVSILTTSREVLRTHGEAVYRVAPLEVPREALAETDALLGYSATELFISRATEMSSDFVPDANSLRTIAQICRRLDGIPLAIEFAAARAVTLGIEQVAAGLSDRFALLTSGRRTAMPRHQTLRATLDWSYELLPDPERSLLRRLSVFAGGFDLDAAVAVDTGRAAEHVVDDIGNLVAKSLVMRDVTASPGRWKLLETIRDHAARKLVESGESVDARRRHADFFRARFAPPEAGVSGRQSHQDLVSNGQDIDNVRAALDWSFSADGDWSTGVAITASYAPVWLDLSLISECHERCERALAALADDPSSDVLAGMHLRIAMGTAMVPRGAVVAASVVLNAALETAKNLHDLDAQARAVWALATLHVSRGAYDAVWSAAEQLQEIADRGGDAGVAFLADRYMGDALLAFGRAGEARLRYEHALRSPAMPDDQPLAIWFHSGEHARAHAQLARACWVLGLLDQALAQAKSGLKVLEGSDHLLSYCRVLYFGLCRVALMRGDLEEAERAIAQLMEAARRANTVFWQTFGRLLEGKLLLERGEYAQAVAALQAALETCRQMGWRASYPEFMGALAMALAGLARLDEARAAMDDAIAGAGQREDGQEWYIPELLRMKGEVLLVPGSERNVTEAEDCFDRAARMASQQGALFWELRIALSRARLRLSEGRGAEVPGLLRPVYDRFTEGFETADLRAARAMLDALPS